MRELKEKTFTEGKENAPQERDQEEKYNPNRETLEGDWMKHVNFR